MTLIRIPALVPAVVVAFSLATSGSAVANDTAQANHTHKKAHGFYFGARGGWGALQSALAPTTTFMSTNHYQETVTGDVRNEDFISRARANGVPIRVFADITEAEEVINTYVPEHLREEARRQLEVEGCDESVTGNLRCFVVHVPDHVFVAPFGPNRVSRPILYQAGLAVDETTVTSFDTTLRASAGALFGYRSGPLRVEVDGGVDLFNVITTKRLTRTIRVVDAGFEDGEFTEQSRRILDRRIAERTDRQREELEAAGTTAGTTTSITEQDVKAYTISGNAFLDLEINAPIKPYVGAGAGLSFIGGLDGDPHITWNLQTGISAPLSDRTVFALGYKFQRIEGTEYGDLDSHTGQASLRVDF